MKPCFVANWKMYKTCSEAEDYLRALALQPALRASNLEIILAPPFTALTSVRAQINSAALNVALAGQNLHFAPEGAYTGEVSARMLREVGCGYVMVGHSERRIHFGESDSQIRLKVTAAGDAGLIPILCVGETLQQRQRGEGESVVRRQIEAALGVDWRSEILIAYEPVWAIGTGRTPSPTEIGTMHRRIRACLTASERVRILYGGSVTPDNIADFMREEEVDGALVGGQSLSAENFATIIERGMKGCVGSST
jgi:triosephosphate isomerase